MGRRNLKEKNHRQGIGIRQPYDRVLVVCEGSKTEINYFNSLVDSLKLSTVNIQILDIKQTTPDSLFRKAKELSQYAKKEGNFYNKVYCVFDKDGHTKYSETKDNIGQTKGFYAAYSEPCFEYWLLLHYEDTTKPFICFDELRKDKKFRKHFPGYQKNQDIFTERLQDKIETACQNAKNNPHTNINELVEYLQNIKNR
ncbi:hypothetical protein MNB_SUP05-SYMBIONT-5-604 [hydrothermal vent metagenome]|uniref:Uncharacterized protein n=1 Tax=hydrothermal vent metagenome TaxID=652676 RepID=A0A1W1E0J9_9ZZZZ